MTRLFAHKNTRKIGDRYEDVAENYLKNQGLKTIERNFTCAIGEIDLIMLDSHTLVFIEVRYRKSSHFGSAVETVGTAKQRKIILTAENFLSQHKKYQLSSCRFDVFGIDKTDTGQLQFNWIQHAFME